jgi:hypothetical protein
MKENDGYTFNVGMDFSEFEEILKRSNTNDFAACVTKALRLQHLLLKVQQDGGYVMIHRMDEPPEELDVIAEIAPIPEKRNPIVRFDYRSWTDWVWAISVALCIAIFIKEFVL